MLALLVALSHAKMASEKRACPPTQATCVGARGAGDHESNELSRKQLWLHPRYCCLGVRSVRPKGEGESKREKWGEQQQRGELTLLQYGVRRAERERGGGAVKFGLSLSFPIINVANH